MVKAMSDEDLSAGESSEERAQRLESELRTLRSEVAVPSVGKSRAKTVGITAGAASAVGSVLPWASVGPFTVNGTSGDGTITLVLGLIALAVAFRLPKSSVVLMILGGLILAIGLFDIVNISGRNNELFQASIGIGLVLTTIAGCGLLVSWYLARGERKALSASAPG